MVSLFWVVVSVCLVICVYMIGYVAWLCVCCYLFGFAGYCLLLAFLVALVVCYLWLELCVFKICMDEYWVVWFGGLLFAI